MSGNLPYACFMIKTRSTKLTRGNHAPAVRKMARLEARITEQQKAMIERAAAYEGRSVTDFVVHALAQVAKTVVHDHEVLRLNPAQSRAFVQRLLKPSKPNRALRAAAKKHRRSVATR
jgi:uncharacterized protein (DUF1778 family)